MKTLVVYSKESFFRFPDLYKLYNYIYELDGALIVYTRCPSNGEEDEHAVFRNWDYYMIERDEDE